jgi:hypothetical protein
MSEFIVLGLIPGTHIQITFVLWIIFVSVLSGTLLVWLAHRARLVSTWVVAISLFVLTRRKLQA